MSGFQVNQSQYDQCETRANQPNHCSRHVLPQGVDAQLAIVVPSGPYNRPIIVETKFEQYVPGGTVQEKEG